MSDQQPARTGQHAPKDKPMAFATYAWTALAAALIGFAAVYVTFGSADNGITQNSAPVRAKSGSPAQKSAAAAPTKKKASALNTALNTGHMITFVFKEVPQVLPEVSFTDGQGKRKTLKDWRGKVVLLNLWATWCAPCRREMPDLDKLQATLGSDRFEVLAVSVDRKGLTASKRFLDQIKVKNLGLYNDVTARMAAKLKVLGMPTTLLLDREGREIGRLVGPAQWNSEDAHRLIKAHL